MNYSLKKRIGLLLLRYGSKLSLSTESDIKDFKDKINADTWFGSFICSGNHLCGYIQPVDEFTAQSIINVLTHKHSNYNMVVTNRIEYYKEAWLHEANHKPMKRKV